MYTSLIIPSLAALATVVSAVPARTVRRAGGEVATYWGFGGERDLADYCNSGEGVNTLILSFLSNFGGGAGPNGGFGDCSVQSDGSFSGCSGLASDVQTCQNAGVKVFVSLGGASGSQTISSEDDANGIASTLWSAWGGDTSYDKRPFGDVKVDGWDFDIESNPNNQSQAYLGTIVSSLRGKFSSDTSKTYYISGAPQCPIPEDNMGPAMMQAQFDYLFIQFYNNDCAASGMFNSSKNPDGDGTYNLDQWPGYLSSGASSNAALYIGIPGSGASAPRYDFIYPMFLPKLISASPDAAGVMVWNSAASDATVHNGCNYIQTVASVFSSGAVCSSSNKARYVEKK